MANEIALNKDFKEKLFEKIQADIGSLLGEEEMKALVASAFERTFFQERRVHKTYGSDEIKPPLIQELVEKALLSAVESTVQDLVKERSDEIMNLVDTMLKDGASAMFIRALDNMFADSMSQFRFQIMDDLTNRQ